MFLLSVAILIFSLFFFLNDDAEQVLSFPFPAPLSDYKYYHKHPGKTTTGNAFALFVHEVVFFVHKKDNNRKNGLHKPFLMA
ncbi:MAG: hypothetical protein EGR15_06355 [Lachnospiraceae bacterium]|nr:hypothetical protein [Lachnospiraceae bacterium]